MDRKRNYAFMKCVLDLHLVLVSASVFAVYSKTVTSAALYDIVHLKHVEVRFTNIQPQEESYK